MGKQQRRQSVTISLILRALTNTDAPQPSSQSASTLMTPPSVHSSSATWVETSAGYSAVPTSTEMGSDRIKAMWQQSVPNGSNPENSLKGIADEFPAAIPSSVQEMKSDDGDSKQDGLSGTASPAQPEPAASRRSLLNIHKAFQVVPTMSASKVSPPSYQPTPTFVTPRPPEHQPPVSNPPFAMSSPYSQHPPGPHQSVPPSGYYGMPPTQHQPQQMMWGPHPTTFNGNHPQLAHRLQAPHGQPTNGHSPPLAPSSPWPQPQYVLSPSQFAYMQRPVGPQMGTVATGPNTPSNISQIPHLPSTGQNAQLPMYPGPTGRQGTPHNALSQNLPPTFSPRPSPHLYPLGPVSPSHGYGQPPSNSGAGRGMTRAGYDISPPTNGMYPQPGRW